MISLLDPTGQVGRLLDAAVQVQELAPKSVLVGGLAVICRLATAHRPTLDADTVVEEGQPDVIALLHATAESTVGDFAEPQRAELAGATVEIIEIGPVTPDQLAQVEDPKDRLFVAAHRWALDTSERVSVDTLPTSGVRSLSVAAPAALAATKTHALIGRRGGREDKVGSDLLDLISLLEHEDRHGALTAELEAAPFEIRPLMGQLLEDLLTDPQRSTRALRLASAASGSIIQRHRLDDAFERLRRLAR